MALREKINSLDTKNLEKNDLLYSILSDLTAELEKIQTEKTQDCDFLCDMVGVLADRVNKLEAKVNNGSQLA